MFEFIDRNHSRNIVLIPGWAFDFRIFGSVDLPYNYFLAGNGFFVDFEDKLKTELKSRYIDRVSILGFSQGAFVAGDFAAKNPEITEEVILVGARKKYNEEAIDGIKNSIAKNKKAYLYRFYKECFSVNDDAPFRWFKRTLMKSYLAEMSLDKLIEGLEWLKLAQIQNSMLEKLPNVKIVHGKNDSIAPVSEAVELAESLPRSQLVLFENTGHLPFLQKDFKKHLYEQ